tara:strand:- start:314 stop:445 length:132 start_codon:yes stop_codon:yes gene_type:complete
MPPRRPVAIRKIEISLEFSSGAANSVLIDARIMRGRINRDDLV